MVSESEKSEKVESKNSHKKDEYWIVGKIFWGLLLMLIGGLLLAANFGFVKINWTNLWRLWPLFIIAAGLSVLSLKHILWRIFLIIMALAALCVVAWSLVVGFPDTNINRTTKSSVQIDSIAIKQAEINVKAGAGTINVNSINQKEIAKASLESSLTDLTKKSSVTGDKQTIDFSMDTKNNWWSSNVRNSLDISLSRSLPLVLNLQAGASDADIDMSQSILEAMSVKIGVSTLSVRLGDRQASSEVSIESGVSTISLKIPKDSGVHLKIDSGLSTKNLTDLVEIESNTYESPNYISSKSKIDIIAKIGLSTFSIDRY